MLPIALVLLSAVSSDARSTASTGPTPLPPDEIELSSGRSLRGRVLLEDEGRVLVQRAEGREELARSAVRSVYTLEDRVGEVLDRLASLQEGELDEQVRLARRARELGLECEAQVLLLRVVLRNPSHEEAQELLGHKRFGSSWRAPWRDEWLPLSSLARKRTSWQHAWEFHSAHWSLRTNLDLPTALEVVLDLEIVWRAFYEVLGKPLALHSVPHRLEAHVHADFQSLPFLEDDRPGWFDWNANRLVVDASRGFDRSLLFHEATHQLLFNTHDGPQRGGHPLPPWLDEGLAEFVQAGLSMRTAGFRQVPGRTFQFDWRSWCQPHVELVLRAPEAPVLEKVLGLRHSDFALRRRGNPAYAQAYALVDFLMNSDGGRYQPQLFGLMRAARERTVEPEDFLALFPEAALGSFEKDWIAYVGEFDENPEAARRRRGRAAGR